MIHTSANHGIEAGVEPVSPQELFSNLYLSLHAPHNAETHHAVNADTLARCNLTYH